MNRYRPMILALWLACTVATIPGAAHAADQTLTFLAVGDPQINIPRLGTEGTEQTLVWMNDIESRSFPLGGVAGRPQGILVLGDLVDDLRNPANWTKYASLFDPRGHAVVRIPAYECIGNHDLDGTLPAGSFSVVQEAFIERNQQRVGPLHLCPKGYHYSWDWEPLHLVCLNLFPGTEPRPVYDRPSVWNDPHDSLTFLRADLATRVGDSGRPVILFWHYGLTGWGLEKWWTQDDLAALETVLRPYNVVLILHGHEHAYRRYRWAGYDVCMAPSPQFDRDPKQPGSTSRPKGFLVIRLRDAQLEVAYFAEGQWRQAWSKPVELGRHDIQADRRCANVYGYCLNPEMSAATEAFASPNSMRVFSLKNRGLSTPANPGLSDRLSTMQVRARSTSMIGIPASGLD
jgi:hypothetical protein